MITAVVTASMLRALVTAGAVRSREQEAIQATADILPISERIQQKQTGGEESQTDRVIMAIAQVYQESEHIPEQVAALEEALEKLSAQLKRIKEEEPLKYREVLQQTHKDLRKLDTVLSHTQQQLQAMRANP